MKIISVVMKNEKPRVRFCHLCSEKLRGNHHAVVTFEGIKHDFIYHKDCVKRIKHREEK